MQSSGSRRQMKAVIGVAAAATLAWPVSSTQAGITLSFGLNQYGQIGNGTTGAGAATNSALSPVNVVGLSTGVSSLAAGGGHSLVARNGAIYAWGLQVYGELGNGVTGGAATDGPLTPQPGVVLTSGVTSVATGLYYSVAIANGAVYTFGGNTGGALGVGQPTSYSTGTPALVTSMASGVTAINAGQQHVLAIKNGELYGWGYNAAGQIGNGLSGTANNALSPVAVNGMSSGVSAIGAGTLHSLAVKDGAAYAWGYNNYGQLGNNGVTSGTGAIYTTPQAVVGLTSGVTDIAAGSNHSLALKDGVVYAWGRNESGQLGTGDSTNSLVPVAVAGITGSISDVEAGSSSSYALGTDGSLWTWGNNTYGQLGLGTSTTPFRTPQHLFAATGYRYTDIDASASASHVLVVMSAMPVYFTGAAGTSLADVANYATTVAGDTAAPIAPVESTDIYFGATNAVVANLNTTVNSATVANSLTFGTGASASNAVTLGGTGTLTLYADKNSYAAGTGVVVQSGAAPVAINVPLALGGSQSWTNNASNALAVTGTVALGPTR
ncbi:MAG: hypothetical protein QM754_00075 [Tepidisphaeraceae bacterium]